MSGRPSQLAVQCSRLRGALACVLVAAFFAGAAQAQTKIVTGMVARGPPQWPQYIATETANTREGETRRGRLYIVTLLSSAGVVVQRNNYLEIALSAGGN